jgi:adenosylmethionine-8-amino-7-oxononanoate aminotransferase
MSATDVAAGPRLFPQNLRRSYRTIVRAEGIRLWDSEGREYIDGDSGAISVVSVGHGVADVVDAMAEQARRFAYVHDGQFLHEVGEALAEEIAAFAPGALNRSTFTSGGSEAVETAVKLARQYHLLRRSGDKHLVISRNRSYHGATLFALSLSGVPARQEPYAPYMRSDPKIAAPYTYRSHHGADAPGAAYADELERVIADVGAENVSAFIAEPIVAAAGPAITPPPGYYQRVREICDAYDVLFIADEVVTGFGRTGRNFGIEHWDAEPDIIVSAKGLAGGYVPLGTVIMSDSIASTFADARVSFTHSLTYGSHPVACAAALAVLRIIKRDGLVENAARRGERLFKRLGELAEAQPLIGDVRGKGLLAGIEVVSDGETKAPFPPALELARVIHEAAQERGLMVYPGAGADGVAGDQILVSPPLIVTDDEVDTIVERLALALEDVAAALLTQRR